MAGHFILRSITNSDLTIATSKGATWSALQHGSIGWNTASRAVLSKALAGQPIGNRDGLPPHRYLESKASVGATLEKYLRSAGWAGQLIRPASAGLGLRELSPKAKAAWDRGDHTGALVEQFLHGTATVEVYYISGTEMS
ncbi:hypothetical protein FGW37_11025 [Streptomyces rectiverticillatus]|uniref:hypothetical protein n=1 Tax=Streptomyces rectiverticillatus TaxID=173860 RepID=UPI0015C2E864|nr:hypothetical protein [Streptomyces rectiverticillatus]QLE72065.1 hypothetical protein FGW37_11025 [Streptomyces rectiverticillatus]